MLHKDIIYMYQGTIPGLLATVHSWLTILEKDDKLGDVFLDLHKAFDSVPHDLMSKLQQVGLTHYHL